MIPTEGYSRKGKPMEKGKRSVVVRNGVAEWWER